MQLGELNWDHGSSWLVQLWLWFQFCLSAASRDTGL